MSLPDIRIQNTGEAQSNVPFTFGQVFKTGDLMQGEGLTAKLADGSTIPLQVDFKASHGDKSVRHALVSGVLPSLAKGATAKFDLVKAARVSDGFHAWPSVDAKVTLTISGAVYTAAMPQSWNDQAPWLLGNIVDEMSFDAPLLDEAGAVHRYLTVKFAVRIYHATKAVRVEVIVENTWSYEPNPQNFTYDVLVEIGGKTVFSQTALTHYHHARWRKLFWTGAEPAIHIQHNTAYLIETKALPNYDQSIVFPESTLAALGDQYAGTNTGPMGLGLSMAYMPTTGGRPDIGLLPGWAATYLLTMDKRAKDATLGTAQLAGSYSSHYRDKNTGKPISLFDYPYMTVIDPHVGDTRNPDTGKLEAFPEIANGETPYAWDVAHQPNYAYLPYLVTGDYYFLEELQFWASVNSFNGHPGYRENIKGLVIAEQLRGSAWALRTLAGAAYIMPDSDRFKGQFTKILNNNLDWYNEKYTSNPEVNKLGILAESIGYLNMTAVAPWQDDYFTSAIGHVADLGFEKAVDFLKYKAKFSVLRMTGACWLDAAAYNIVVRDKEFSPIYYDMATAYRATHTPEFNALECNSQAMADALGVPKGSMSGGPGYPAGYPSNMQPALAAAVDSGIPSAKKAWELFMSRSVKPDYSEGPAFAILPRDTVTTPPVVVAPVVTPPPPPVQPPNPPVVSPITPPVARTGKVVTPSSTALVSLMKSMKVKQFTYQIFDIQNFNLIREFKDAAPTSKGVFTLIDPVLYISKKRQLAGKVLHANGKVLLVHYPLTVS